MENVRNQQYEASGMVTGEEKIKSHLYCHCCTHKLITNQTTYLKLRDRGKEKRKKKKKKMNHRLKKWLAVLI